MHTEITPHDIINHLLVYSGYAIINYMWMKMFPGRMEEQRESSFMEDSL